jgi:hypothetical protein
MEERTNSPALRTVALARARTMAGEKNMVAT